MSKKVGVLFVHGLGSISEDFVEDTVRELGDRIAGRGLDRDEVAWQSVFWQPMLTAQESQLWGTLSAEHDLNWAKLRKFFIGAFGSIAAYHAPRHGEDSIYVRINDLVHNSVTALRAKLDGEDKPLVVIAHSLGSIIMSNYIWDRQRGRDEARYGATAFERMDTLAGLVTLGTTIPLFTLAVNPVTAIDFPPPALPEKLKKKAKWLNLYDADDVLGWPLKPLSLSYSDAVTEDIEVSVGNILTSWNPANHAAYWTEPSVLKPAAYLISTLLEACSG